MSSVPVLEFYREMNSCVVKGDTEVGGGQLGKMVSAEDEQKTG